MSQFITHNASEAQVVVTTSSPETNHVSSYNRAQTLASVASPAAEAMGDVPSSSAHMG